MTNSVTGFLFAVLVFVTVIWFVNKENFSNVPNKTFRVVMLLTPNYDHIGCFGANSMKQYCNEQGYQFTLYRKKGPNDLHINFTKNSMTLDALKKYKEDFIVSVDADILVREPKTKITDLFNADDSKTVMWAPQDRWQSPKSHRPYPHNTVINAGFIIWRNCEEAQTINEDWMKAARGEIPATNSDKKAGESVTGKECSEISEKHPRQQRVFHKCVYPFLPKGTLRFLDFKKVGMRYSSFISQVGAHKFKDKPHPALVKNWEARGKPDFNMCSLKS